MINIQSFIQFDFDNQNLLSAVSFQLSAIGYQLSALSYQLLAVRVRKFGGVSDGIPCLG